MEAIFHNIMASSPGLSLFHFSWGAEIITMRSPKKHPGSGRILIAIDQHQVLNHRHFLLREWERFSP